MQFRARGQRDDRRRRLLGDEQGSAAACRPDTVTAGDKPGIGREETDAKARYAQAVLPQNQRPVTDLIPMRWLTVALLVTTGVLGIAAVEGAHYWLPQMLSEEIDRSYAERLAAWLGSTFAMITAGMSLLVYAVRRHQVDDYSGRYRIWLWAAACWMLLAASAVADLGELGRLLMIHAMGWTDPTGREIWAIAPLGSMVLLIGVRVFFDMRESRLATGLFLAAGVLAMASIVMRHNRLEIADQRFAMMVESGLSMAAYLLLLVSVSLHARHLLRDAQGLVPIRPAKPAKAKRQKTKRKKAPSMDETPAQTTESNSGKIPESTAQKRAAKRKRPEKVRTDLNSQTTDRDTRSNESTPVASTSDNAKTANAPVDDRSTRKLSKAERRRLRKQKRRGLKEAA